VTAAAGAAVAAASPQTARYSRRRRLAPHPGRALPYWWRHLRISKDWWLRAARPNQGAALPCSRVGCPLSTTTR